jgi:general stress protein YciG
MQMEFQALSGTSFAKCPYWNAKGHFLFWLEDFIMAARRGFAAMEENQRRQIASRGGRAAHQAGNAHEWNEHEAAEAGRKGGQKVSQNRQHMAAIGRKGGLAAHQRTRQSAQPPPADAQENAQSQEETGNGPAETAVQTQAWEPQYS